MTNTLERIKNFGVGLLMAAMAALTASVLPVSRDRAPCMCPVRHLRPVRSPPHPVDRGKRWKLIAKIRARFAPPIADPKRSARPEIAGGKLK